MLGNPVWRDDQQGRLWLIVGEPSDTIRRAPLFMMDEDMVHCEGINQRNSLSGKSCQ